MILLLLLGIWTALTLAILAFFYSVGKANEAADRLVMREVADRRRASAMAQAATASIDDAICLALDLPGAF